MRREEIINVVSNNKDIVEKSQDNITSYLLNSKRNVKSYSEMK